MSFNVDGNDTEVVEDEVIYTHPSLRTSKHEWLLERLQQIRDRRLVIALQYESKRVDKLTRLNTQLSQQYEKQDERNRLDLAKVDELIDKLDRGISKQIEIGHKLAITEEG